MSDDCTCDAPLGATHWVGCGTWERFTDSQLASIGRRRDGSLIDPFPVLCGKVIGHLPLPSGRSVALVCRRTPRHDDPCSMDRDQ